MNSAINFAPLLGPTARRLLGEPNRSLSTPKQLRFGNHGSMAVDIAGEKNGTWYDHEAGEGGGVLDLVRFRTGLSNGKAIDWLRREVGADIPDSAREAAEPAQRPRIAATYDYLTADGEVGFQVVRMEPKTFRQRRPDGKGGWDWSVKGLDLYPYRLPELLASSGPVFVVEGEKDVDALLALGITATTNPGGAGKWPNGCTPPLRGRDVIVLPDNDGPGQEHASLVRSKLAGSARSVRVLDLPGLPPKGDVADWIAAGGTADALRALAAEKSQGPEVEPFPVAYFEDVQPCLDAADFVQGLLTEGSAAVAYGESNAGKTFLVTDLALHVAAGLPWHGLRVEQGGVLYLALEGGIGFRNRIAVWRQAHGMEDARLPFAAIQMPINMLDPEADTPRLVATVQAHRERMGGGVKLIVIDTLSRALSGGNENAPEDMGALVRNMDALRAATGACVLFIHHSGKDASRGARGHSLLRAAIDTELEVSADEDAGTRQIKAVKQREMAKGQSFPFALDVVVLGQNRHGEDVTSCVVRPDTPEAMSPEDARRRRVKALPGDSREAFNILQDLIARSGASGFPGAPDSVLSVPEDWWRTEFYQRGKPGAEQATKQKAFVRALKALVEQHAVASNRNRVWITW